MNERILLHLTLVLIILLAAACVPIVPETEISPDTPHSIQVWDGITVQRYEPGDEGFERLNDAWQMLRAAVGSRARTFFSPERFREEVVPYRYVRIEYPRVVSFQGANFQFEAAHVVVVVMAGELLVLGQKKEGEDWSVYLPTNNTVVEQFIAKVKEISGVDLMK